MSMGTPVFYFKIDVLISYIFSRQSLSEILLSVLFQRNNLMPLTTGLTRVKIIFLVAERPDFLFLTIQ